MNIFLDANIIVSVLNKEYPLFTYSARVLSLAGHQRFQVYTSPLSLAIGFYFASKKSNEKNAKLKIEMLIEHIHLTAINQEICRKAIQNQQVHDFEDGLQYYSAMNEGCEVILTTDIGDFYFSQVSVMGCEEFLKANL